MGAKEDHPLSFQLSSCSNLSPLQHSAGDTDCSPEGITIRLLFVPRINFQTVADNLNSVEHVTPRTNRITPQILCSFTLSSPPLEMLWPGGLRVEAGKGNVGTQLNSLQIHKSHQLEVLSLLFHYIPFLHFL